MRISSQVYLETDWRDTGRIPREESSKAGRKPDGTDRFIVNVEPRAWNPCRPGRKDGEQVFRIDGKELPGVDGMRFRDVESLKLIITTVL